jgi:hypothetical protein
VVGEKVQSLVHNVLSIVIRLVVPYLIIPIHFTPNNHDHNHPSLAACTRLLSSYFSHLPIKSISRLRTRARTRVTGRTGACSHAHAHS